MADERYPDGDNYPRDVDPDVSADDLDAVRAQLAGLTFLLPPDSVPADEPMPDEVWDRLSAVLAAESAPSTSLAAARSSHSARWAGGLVAASVAILAVGVSVTVLRTPGEAVVANEIVASSAAAGLSADAGAAAAAEAFDAGVLAAPNALSFAGMVPPARMVVDSDMAYTSTALRSQVTSVLTSFGMGSERQAKTAMAEAATVDVAEDVPSTGFTSSAQALRDCIDKLTEQSDTTVLLVDRSTFEGFEAGVVVAPEEPSTEPTGEPASSQPQPAMLRVWVVDEDCNPMAEGFTLRLTP